MAASTVARGARARHNASIGARGCGGSVRDPVESCGSSMRAGNFSYGEEKLERKGSRVDPLCGGDGDSILLDGVKVGTLKRSCWRSLTTNFFLEGLS